MVSNSDKMYPKVLSFLEKATAQRITPEREKVLEPLIEYIQVKTNNLEEIYLNFICTHNSRRSQFSQVWAKVAADYYGIEIKSLSGGVEVTAFNPRAIKCLERCGFEIFSENRDVENPSYSVAYLNDQKQLIMFSKLFNDKVNESKAFAAIMTCSHADENCPFIPGTEKRIALNYSDPKDFDDTSEEAAKYDERSLQIASEMMFVFSKINTK